MDSSLIEKVVRRLQDLPYESQQRVLEFTQTLAESVPRGAPGNKLLRFAGSISLDEAKQISLAIKEGCEQVNSDEW